MNNENEKLKQCLFEAMEADVAKLREQTESSEPHVFSQKFEAGMQVIIDGVEKKSKRRVMMKKIAVASAAALVLAVGGLSLSTNNANASKPVVDIVAWAKEYFNFEKGDNIRREESISFDESQIGFIPEGFERVGEERFFTSIQYKFENKQGESFVLYVSQEKISNQLDNKDIDYIIEVNSDGYEYTYTYKEDEHCHVFLWEDTNGVFYNLSGEIDEDILIAIMNGIEYKGR